jgi:circadian clock protein KaiC
MTDKVRLGLLSTGVPGLDVLLGGGLPEFSFTLIAGAPGCGKTTLAHQIMFALASPERRALFFTVLGEPPLKMLRYQQQFGFFDMAKVGPCIRYVNLADDLRAGQFTGVLERIMREVEDFQPSLVFVDSFRSVAQAARADAQGATDLQEFIQELGSRMATWQATTFLIGEYAQGDVEANPIITVADGIVELSQPADDSAGLRKVRVVKMRGQGHMTGSHTMRITDDGIRVYPRLLPTLPEDREPGHAIDRDPRRVSTGVPGLDEMLHGGLPQGHTLLASGPTGVGKTILATRFLQAGVQAGEKGVAVFFEKGTSRLRNAELAEMVQAGQVAVVESRSLSLSVEEVLDEMMSAIDRLGATRVVVDSLSELELFLAPEERRDLRLVVFRTLAPLAKRGVTAVVTVGVDDTLGLKRLSPYEVTFLTDAVVALRYAEVDGRLGRFITVIKVRGSNHSDEVRQFHITERGIEIDPLQVPYEGLLSGWPRPRGT